MLVCSCEASNSGTTWAVVVWMFEKIIKSLLVLVTIVSCGVPLYHIAAVHFYIVVCSTWLNMLLL